MDKSHAAKLSTEYISMDSVSLSVQNSPAKVYRQIDRETDGEMDGHQKIGDHISSA